MSYQVGVDVGGTFTTVAVARGGRAEVVKTVPSRLPGVPRGFLRRVGDDTPVIVGAQPVPAETLVAQLIRQVTTGLGTPGRLAVTHPVTWGPHRVATLRAALGEVTLLSTAAAVAHRTEAPAAVHDLGGTTCTAAVVGGVGQPRELDVGGADLDELVFDHVLAAVGEELPPAELARLRQSCTTAKETLSAATEVEIPVAGKRIRLTRAEFDDLARPLLTETAAALHVTIEESGVTPAHVLLAGGGAWIPLLTQVVSAELGRPVTATPPGAAAMGAALAAVPLPTNDFAPPTTLVEPVRPPVPIPTAPPVPTTRRPRTTIAVAAASLVAVGAVGAVGAILLTTRQTPPGADADPIPTTTTVTETVPTTPSADIPPPADTPTRQAPRTQRTNNRPKATTTTTPTPTTTTEVPPTTTPPETTTTNTPAITETTEGGDR